MRDKKNKTEACFICSETKNLRECKKCRNAFGCSDHLIKHSNGSYCYPLRVHYSPSKGHYLVATRKIKPGEIVLKEAAAIVGKSTKNFNKTWSMNTLTLPLN